MSTQQTTDVSINFTSPESAGMSGARLRRSRVTSSGPSLASPARVPLAPRGERRTAGCNDRRVFRCDRSVDDRALAPVAA